VVEYILCVVDSHIPHVRANATGGKEQGTFRFGGYIRPAVRASKNRCSERKAWLWTSSRQNIKETSLVKISGVSNVPF